MKKTDERGRCLYLVVPCYNEEEMLPLSIKSMTDKLTSLIERGMIDRKSRILFVNDGSADSTWEIIEKSQGSNEYICGIDLSRNRGHQNALMAGLMIAKEKADMVISMDADLQDDIDAVDEMVKKYYDGCEIVYGVRSKRQRDSFFKRFSAEAFYRLMNSFGAQTIFNHADYRLMSKKALEALSEFKEANLFLRGIVPMIGFRNDVVYYERNERTAGESKYPLKKMLAFAVEGITSFSIKPIRIITLIGLIMFAASFVMLIYILVAFFMGNAISGWASTLVSVWIIGGLSLLSIGIVGEYIGKIYLESKHRPKYHINKLLGIEEEDED